MKEMIGRLKSYLPGPGGEDSQFAADLSQAVAALTQQREAEPVVKDMRAAVMESLIHVGYTNPLQIEYGREAEGIFYPDTNMNCFIPLYMLKTHVHRLGRHSPSKPAAQPQVPEEWWILPDATFTPEEILEHGIDVEDARDLVFHMARLACAAKEGK